MDCDSVSNQRVRPVVRGRFAPSPSGRMHMGNIYAALMAWIAARQEDGRVVMRVEDLDPRTHSGPWTDLLLEDLRWLGLDWDEGPYYQHERCELYQDALQRLRNQGLLYPCFCTRAELHAACAPHASDGTPLYAGTCRSLSAAQAELRRRERPAAWRLRVPAASDEQGTISFMDRTYGKQTEVLAQACGDFLVQRSDGVYAYQLAVVVDDAEMGVTQVVRGNDLMSSTARQIYLQRLLGYPQPEYAHIPVLCAADGRRLSKRNRDLNMGELRKIFDSPRKLLGYVAHTTGLTPDASPRSADDLVEMRVWDIAQMRRERITVC